MRYQEKSLIVKCFTEAAGIKSYYIRNAFTSRKSAQKNVYFRPLTLLEIEATHKNKGTLEYFKDVRLAHPYQSLHTDIVKTTIAIFIADVLHHCVKEEECNPALYQYLETSLLWLDNHDESANFHLTLLLELSKYLGFYPSMAINTPGYFEMAEGIFITEPTITCLSAAETALLKRLMGLKAGNGSKNFNVAERQVLLRILMDYYALHLDSFVKPKSLEILKEVFS